MKRLAGLGVLVLLAFGCGGGSGGGADGAGGGGGGGGGGDGTGGAGGALTLVSLGDSLTEGTGDGEYDDEGLTLGFPGRVRARLAARGIPTELVNLGRAGWTSDDLVRGIDWTEPPEPSQLSRALPLLEAAVAADRRAVVTVWIGSSDLFSLYGWCHAPDNAACEAGALETYTANVDTALEQLAATGATVFIALLDDQSKRPVLTDPAYDATFPDVGDADLPLMSAQVTAFNEAVTTLAAAHGARLVDIYDTTIFEQTATLNEDGFHPNAAGYEALAAIWENAIGAGLGL